MSGDFGWDVVVIGGANTDYLVRGGVLPQLGQTVEGHTFDQAPGGKGANQAVAAARLGARVSFLARLGADQRADELIARLSAENVDVSAVVRDAEAATGAALIMVNDAGQKQIFTAPGANRRFSVTDVQAAAHTIQRAKVVLSQLEVPIDAVEEAFRLGRAAGAKIVLDTAPPQPLPDDLLGMVDCLRANAHEVEVVTGIPVRDRATARLVADCLIQRGAIAVAIEAGEEGNLLAWRGGELFLPKVPVKAADATGAGDAFAAAIAVMLAEGRSLAEAGPFASAAAALATTVLGAQAGLPTREAVETQLAEMGGAHVLPVDG